MPEYVLQPLGTQFSVPNKRFGHSTVETLQCNMADSVEGTHYVYVLPHLFISGFI